VLAAGASVRWRATRWQVSAFIAASKLKRGYPLAWRGFANAGPEPVKVLALAVPGGIEDVFAGHAAYLASAGGREIPQS
jgi:hypothetical protein